MINDYNHYKQVKEAVEEWASQLESLSGTDQARWVVCNGWTLITNHDIHHLIWTGRRWRLEGTQYVWRSRRIARKSIKRMNGQLIMDISVQPQRPVEYISVDLEFTNK